MDPHTLNLLHRRKWKEEKREREREFLSEFPACVAMWEGGKEALVAAGCVPFRLRMVICVKRSPSWETSQGFGRRSQLADFPPP